MKLLLISINQQDVEEYKKAPTDISALGVRYLSSYLKSRGHKVNILFLCKPYGELESEDELKQINGFIGKLRPDLIGVGLMSNHFFRARKITQGIKKAYDEMPIIWGGIHPTIDPEGSLAYADLVCVGEGELAMEQLMALSDANNFKNSNIEGIWYKVNDRLIDKGCAKLVADIDSLPLPDYDLADHYIVHSGQLVVLSENIFKLYYPASRGDHRLISSRGCPHACAYCCNSTFRNIYGGQYLRRRSVEKFIDEMLAVKNRFSFVSSFKIMDDSFTVNSLEWFGDFNRQYKEKIQLPFFCLTSPLTIDEDKLALLIDAGLKTIQIGLQSGSDRTNKEIYLRHVSAGQFLSAMKLFEKYKDKLNVLIDVIVDNPYESDDDLKETIKVISLIKKPYQLSMFSLAFYPGTLLYKRAKEDKILPNEQEYLKKQFHLFRRTYLNKVIYLISHLPAAKIEYFTKNEQNLFARLQIWFWFFAFSKKNKLPTFALKILSRIKRVLVR